jgi:hypothetical protein
MIDKKQLIEELLECVKDATDTETQITGLSMCSSLMNEVLDEALTLTDVVEPFYCDVIVGEEGYRCKKQCDMCKEFPK